MLGLGFYFFSSRPKIAYVKTLELVYSYNGMRQAHTEYKTQLDEWQKNVDTLQSQYRLKVTQYRSDSSKLSPQQRTEALTEIRRLETNLDGYTNAVQKEAAGQEKKLTQEVLNQVNSFVQDYAKKKGYDIVLGAEGNGNVLYGTKAYDITADVLAALNKGYKIVPGNKSNSNLTATTK